jgi:uncharacterized protein involved in exopolysaccharide biosynthesis
MEQITILPPADFHAISFPTRELIAVGFRRKRLIATIFFGILLGATLCALFLSREYKSTMEILVKRQRLDPVVSTQATTMSDAVRGEITEEEMNTEVQLITSRDLLEEVVVTCGLVKPPGLLARILKKTQPDLRLAKGIDDLESRLTVEPVKKSDIIEVTYRQSSPAVARQVLAKLAELYMNKHATLHSEPGTADFFGKQADLYKDAIAKTQERLQQFGQQQGTVAAHTERDIAVQRANEFEASLRQTNSAIEEARHRITMLEQQIASTPHRMVTSDRNEDSQLLTELRQQLTTLQLQRSDLLAKYEPSYRPVKDLDVRISQLQQAIADEEKAPLRQVTTDANPTSTLLDEELARARVDLSSLTARAASLQQSVANYRNAAQIYNAKEIQEEELTRELQQQEQASTLYVTKRDEARIADALDDSHIVNVALAETPTLPYRPTQSPFFIMLLGFVLATMLSVGSVCVAEYLDRSFHTPQDVELYLSSKSKRIRCMSLSEMKPG